MVDAALSSVEVWCLHRRSLPLPKQLASPPQPRDWPDGLAGTVGENSQCFNNDYVCFGRGAHCTVTPRQGPQRAILPPNSDPELRSRQELHC